jgi:hypothetical protein
LVSPSTDDPSAAVEARAAGYGMFQSLALGLNSWSRRGDLVQILGDWSDELYPLYVYHPARQLPLARFRALLYFI